MVLRTIRDTDVCTEAAKEKQNNTSLQFNVLTMIIFLVKVNAVNKDT